MQETPIISRLFAEVTHTSGAMFALVFIVMGYANCCDSSKRTGAITGLEVCTTGAGLRPSKGHTCSW